MVKDNFDSREEQERYQGGSKHCMLDNDNAWVKVSALAKRNLNSKRH